jgi:hypothetical protein
VWHIQNVDSPSLDNESLRCSIRGGAAYSNAHFYRIFTSEPLSVAFALSVSFRFTPTTCNNTGSSSPIQGLEFTMSKFWQDSRWEFALQWENVAAMANDGAPQWRFWTGSQWARLSHPVPQCLQSDQWHELTLVGQIVEGQVHYERFVVNRQVYSLDINVPPVPANDVGRDDRLAIGVQLDSNAQATAYDVFVDKVNFYRSSVPMSLLTLELNQPAFRAGETLRARLRVKSPGSAFNADFYCGVLLPGETNVVFISSQSPLRLTGCALTDPGCFQPLMADVLVPQDLDIVVDDLLNHQFQGGEPAGSYVFFVALTSPGAFRGGGRNDRDIVGLASQPFALTL